MRNIAFINLTDINSSCQNRILQDKTAARLILEYCNAIPDLELIIPVAMSLDQIEQFYGEKNPEKQLILSENSVSSLISSLSEEADGFDNAVYLWGDTPLLDRALTEKMFRNHYKYYADYSFADGYPYGLSPEILSISCLKQLVPLSEGEDLPIGRDAVFHCLQKDINAFDIETEIAPRDMRLKRISLSCDTLRNCLQMERIIAGGGTDSASIIEMDPLIEKYTRTLPAYFQIQLTGKCLQSCSYCPYPEMNPDHRKSKKNMPSDKMLDLARRIDSFAPDSVISLSLWGDPVCYLGLDDLLKRILAETGLKILIETAGLGWSSFLKKDPDCLHSDRIEWIFSLDAMDPQLYRKLRGEGQEEVLHTIEAFLQQNRDHTWIQAVRMKENEDDLEKFYRFWKEKTENVIIQKYDNFCGLLEQKKVTDLSPLNRFPCWHLKREMAILADGSVLLCREDIRKEHTLGNVFEKSLDELWNNGDTVFQDHMKSCYTGICENCDEYYTYNF